MTVSEKKTHQNLSDYILFLLKKKEKKNLQNFNFHMKIDFKDEKINSPIQNRV